MRRGSNSYEAGRPSRFFGLRRNGTDLDISAAMVGPLLRGVAVRVERDAPAKDRVRGRMGVMKAAIVSELLRIVGGEREEGRVVDGVAKGGGGGGGYDEMRRWK